MVKKIKKCDGKIAKFDPSKITSAIFKAGKATGEFGEREAKWLTKQVHQQRPSYHVYGTGMEIGKILTVAHLYRNWEKLGGLIRSLYILIVSVLVLLTSVEVIGFLSLSHTNATKNMRTTRTALEGLEKEATILQKQILTIDATLAGLPTLHVTR
ncbi:MAG: hypothetical protein QG552_1613 [Thermodesulfobacteriota bacterium]|nr:hypothetical protein [Thermodesulfobacteriota bacterium]